MVDVLFLPLFVSSHNVLLRQNHCSWPSHGNAQTRITTHQRKERLGQPVREYSHVKVRAVSIPTESQGHHVNRSALNVLATAPWRPENWQKLQNPCCLEMPVFRVDVSHEGQCLSPPHCSPSQVPLTLHRVSPGSESKDSFISSTLFKLRSSDMKIPLIFPGILVTTLKLTSTLINTFCRGTQKHDVRVPTKHKSERRQSNKHEENNRFQCNALASITDGIWCCVSKDFDLMLVGCRWCV